MLIEAEEKIIPLWRCLKESQYGKRLGDRILVLQTLLSLLVKVRKMSGQSEDFRWVLFHSESIKRILCLVPVEVKTDFFRFCSENNIKLEWNESSIPPEADLRNDVVKQSKKDAAENTGEVIDEILIDSLSE